MMPGREGTGVSQGEPRRTDLLTFRKGMTNGRSGKLVASWSLE